ncbi:MAG TPA: S4 domain-containing protein [Gammaproteobacteria bacterium]|nr:S4 domain-containing protein [Gammaproteobacteria bacterium]
MPKVNKSSMNEGMLKIRLDKWLWCARFFKTRSLAAAAVAGGKVHVNGVRVKPAHEVRIGDRLEITRDAERYEIVVRALSAKRGAASAAQQLYEETVASQETRVRHAELRKLAALASPAPLKRPDKKSRRLIHRFKQGL